MSSSKFDIFARSPRIHRATSSLPDDDDEETYVVDCNRTLPVEILTQIFELLPIDARKKVRRTCKYWHDVCSSPRITKREKLVFRENTRFTDMLDILRNSRLTSIDLVLHRHNFGLVPWQVWANFGRKIQSLELRSCDFSSHCIENLIRYCPMLNHLSVHDISHITIKEDVFEDEIDPSDSYISENGTVIQNFLDVLDDLFSRGIRHRNLRTLTLSSNWVVENLSPVKKILRVFPNISNFHLGTWSCWDCTTGRMMDEGSLAQIESLSSFPRNDSAWIGTMRTITQMRNLRHFETWVHGTDSTDSMERVLLDFLLTLEHLEVLRIFFPRPKPIIVDDLLFSVLPRLNNLRDIQIDAEVNLIILSQEKITQFMTLLSKVKRFLCTFTLCSMVNLPPKLTTEICLESLCLKVFAKKEAITLYILEHCSKVKNLKLIKPTNVILQKVFGFMHNLRTLYLYNTQGCSNFAFTGRGIETPGFSIKNLTKLEQLRIYFGVTEREHGQYLPWSIVEEIQFPRLRLLELDTEHEDVISPGRFHLLAQNVPNLEALILPNQYLGNSSETIAILRHWTFLNYFRLACDLTSDGQTVRDAYPSVKFISSNEIISRRDVIEHGLLDYDSLENHLLAFSDGKESGIYEPSDLRYTL